MYKHYEIVDGTKVLDFYGCKESQHCAESERCDCENEVVSWLTTWIWTCNLRSGFLKFYLK